MYSSLVGYASEFPGSKILCISGVRNSRRIVVLEKGFYADNPHISIF